MKTILFILGGKVSNLQPDSHYKLRVDAAIRYYQDNHGTEEIIFFVSGRWTNVTDTYELDEAEIGKRYIQSIVPAAVVYKEAISVQLIGNYAFSKPLLMALEPDRTVIFTSALLHPRNSVLAKRIFADHVPYVFETITNDQSDDEILQEKEKRSIVLIERLFDGIYDGDDAAFRERLLYQTPFYFKGIIDDKVFFDQMWSDGYTHYLRALEHRDTLK